MDQTVLVKEQVRAGARLARDLILNNYPVEDAAWSRRESGDWHLEIVTPLVGSIGRRTAFIRLIETENPNRHPEIDFDQIDLYSPDEASAIFSDFTESNDTLASPVATGLAVAGNAVERYSYNRDPLFYEARVAQEIRRLFSSDGATIDPHLASQVDFVVKVGSTQFAVEAKTGRRPVALSEILRLIGASIVLSMPVILVTPTFPSAEATSIAHKHGNRLRLVKWSTTQDTQALVSAFTDSWQDW